MSSDPGEPTGFAPLGRDLIERMAAGNRTIRYGDKHVPVVERDWKSDGGKSPYPETHKLKVGEHWKDGWTENKFSEHYVLLEGDVIVYPEDRQFGLKYIPAGAAIARELKAEGALWAIWTDCFSAGRELSIVGPDLVCVEKTGDIGELLESLRAANGGSWRGTPDAMALFPDGRVAFRDAKRARNDSLQETQHNFARAAERVLGERAEFAVVEWASAAARR